MLTKLFLVLAIVMSVGCTGDEASPVITVSAHHTAPGLKAPVERAVRFWAERGYPVEYRETGGQVTVYWGECWEFNLFALGCQLGDEIRLPPSLNWWDSVEYPTCITPWDIDTNSTVAHELGHVLGLEHVMDDPEDVMYFGTELCKSRTTTRY